MWKIESWKKGGKPFSSEGYLRNATGPLAPYFRGMVSDVNGLAKLDPARLNDGWEADVRRVAAHFGFDEGQRAKAESVLSESQKFANGWFLDRENREKRLQYYHDLAAVQKVELNPDALENEKLWASGERKSLEGKRKALTKELDARAASLREAVAKIATPGQVESAGSYATPWSLLDYNDTLTAFSLVSIGFCLMMGFSTRPAAVGGAAFLTLIYLAMPPWPGLPANPLENGHYLIVDRNLIELLACLSIACLPTGHWVGLDALFFGWLRRRREVEAELAQVGRESARGRGRAPQRVS